MKMNPVCRKDIRDNNIKGGSIDKNVIGKMRSRVNEVNHMSPVH